MTTNPNRTWDALWMRGIKRTVPLSVINPNRRRVLRSPESWFPCHTFVINSLVTLPDGCHPEC